MLHLANYVCVGDKCTGSRDTMGECFSCFESGSPYGAQADFELAVHLP